MTCHDVNRRTWRTYPLWIKRSESPINQPITLLKRTYQDVKGVRSDAVRYGHGALPLLGHDQAREDLRNRSADGQERETHHRIRDLEGVADDGDHPGDHVGHGTNPSHAHQEGDRVQLSTLRVPDVGDGQEEEDVHGHVDEPPNVVQNSFSSWSDPWES